MRKIQFYGLLFAALFGWATTAHACDLPKNVDIKEEFPFGFTITWDAVKGAVAYRIYFRESGQTNIWTPATSLTNSVTLTGLSAGTKYDIRMRTVCRSDSSSSLLQFNYTTPKISKRNAPQIYTLQMGTGYFADAGGYLLPYGNNEAYAYKIITQKAGKIQLSFTEFSLGANDTLFVYDGGIDGRLIGRYVGNRIPKDIVSSEASVTFLFASDSLTNNSGWAGQWKTVPSETPSTLPALAPQAPAKTQPPARNTKPTPVAQAQTNNPPQNTTPTAAPASTAAAPITSFAASSGYMDNITLTFSDADRSGKGIAGRYVNIATQQAGRWRSNAEKGMMWEDFTKVSGIWTAREGAWSMGKNGKIEQTDNNVKNSNLSAALKQNNQNSYLYHWQFRIEGRGDSRRAGLHFFCSAATGDNRGNSYLAFVREQDKEDDVVELYESTANVLSLKAKQSIKIPDGDALLDLKVTYSPVSGRVEVYFNNEFALSWVDDIPLREGSFVSLRNSGCTLEPTFFAVYTARTASAEFAIGPQPQNDIIATPGAAPLSAQVASIVLDRNQRWSDVAVATTRVSASSAPAGGGATSSDENSAENAPESKPFADEVLTGKPIRGNYTLEFAPEKGVFERYILLGDYDSETDCWRANQTRGFLLDEFCGSSLEEEWSLVRGSWKETDGTLVQQDEANANTNVAISLLQQNDGKYLYQFKFKILDNGENRRVGLHFFADDQESANRGNSYLVVLRGNDKTADQLEMYRVEEDQLQQVATRPIDIKPNQWADIKLIFSPATGVVNVYLNNAVVLYWKDDKAPFSSGKGISLRTGGTRAAFDDVRVYKQYTTRMPVKVGDSMDGLFRYETKQAKPAGRVYQITRNADAKIVKATITESTVFFQ